MSWFSEIASKAEAMLVKLDQDTARVLSNPDNPNQLLNYNDLSVHSPMDRPQEDVDNSFSENLGNNHITQNTAYETSDANHQALQPTSSSDMNNESSEQSVTKSIEASGLTSGSRLPAVQDPNSISGSSRENNRYSTSVPDRSNQRNNNSYSKRFTIQTSKKDPFGKNATISEKITKISASEKNLGDNGRSPSDIRESINQSLQEYTNQSEFGIYSRQNLQSPRDLYFDNNPNLLSDHDITHNEGSNNSHETVSNDFSINIPNVDSCDRMSNYIPTRILKRNMSKRDSAVDIRRFLDRLNSQDRLEFYKEHVRLKLRRVQLRGSSYARRLNYYFKKYPMMKYVIIVNLLAMQLLVVYVLFFYQPSGSSQIDIPSSEIQK